MNVREWFYANMPPEVAAQMDEARTIARDTGLPLLTALIIAGDRGSARRATSMVEDGVPALDAYPFVGSYARIGWLLDMAYAGRIAWPRFYSMLVDKWPGADPDDTDPRFLTAWRGAWTWNGRRTLGDPLPPGRHLTVYRGQGRDDPKGIAWSLSREVAGRFANGAGLRIGGAVRDPVIYVGWVHRRQVIAYLTHRDEAEVILDPATVRVMSVEPWSS